MRAQKALLILAWSWAGIAAALDGSAGFGVGFWLPRQPARSFFGRAGNEFYAVGASLRGKFWALRLDTGFMRESSALRGVGSGRASGERQTLWILDATPGFEAFCCGASIVQPFARAGHAFQAFGVEDPYGDTRGLEQSLSVAGGLRLRLDPILGSRDASDLYSLRQVHLELAARYARPWTEGLDLGGWTFTPSLGAVF